MLLSLKEVEGYTYTEYINKQSVYKLVQNWVDILDKLPDNRKNKIKKSIDEGKDPLVHLKKILKLKSDIIHTKYNFSKNLCDYGRLFPQNASLASLPREFRNTIADNNYYDIDMQNCHPNLLSQYCKKNGIRSDTLDKYIENRNEIIDKLCNDSGIEKEQAKHVFLSLINGGKGGGWNIPKYKGTFIYDFKHEVERIHDAICRLNPDEYKKAQRRKEYNAKGSMMNVLLCKLEHQILVNAVRFFNDKCYNVDVLVFDGLMIRKTKELTNDVLLELKNHIKEQTDYDMVFVQKEMRITIDLNKYVDPVDDDKVDITYFKEKEKFEKTHIKILHPNMYITILNDNTFDYQAESNIVSSYRHLKTTILNEKNKVQKVNFITQWINDENIRCYEQKIFNPDVEKQLANHYNTWRGFDMEKIELIDKKKTYNKYVDTFKGFIDNLFGNNIDSVNYFIAWCANIIQNPANRSCVCLVLYSLEEGAGKNMITKTLELCLGTKYVNYITDVSNQLFGKHSSAEMDKLLIVLNEVKGKDTYANTDLFKTRITDDTREVELKNKDTMQINNYCSYILNTNNLNSVNAGDKDRRFCVLDCNNDKIHDKKYFKNYANEINGNKDAIRCIYQYLKTFNIDEVVPDHIFSDARPRTQLYEELILCNRDKEWEYLEYFIKNNYETYKEKEIIKISLKDIWDSYKYFCTKNNYDISKLGYNRFGFIFSRNIIKTLNKTIGYENTIVKNKSHGIINFHINIIKLYNYLKKQSNIIEDDNDDELDTINYY